MSEARPARSALAAAILALALVPTVARGQGGATSPFGELPSPTTSPSPAARDLPSALPPDLAFGAFQRGYFITALREASKRVSENPQDGAAMVLIGEIYAQGLSVKTDPEEAVHWYKLAADRGNREGAFAYGMALLKGEGIVRDEAAAKAALEKAAAGGHAGAHYNLGVLALGKPGGPQDFKTAAEEFRQGADAGDLDALFGLATLYRAGQGVGKDSSEAASLFKAAADEKHAGAAVEYAVMAFNGEGVPKDEAAAARYFLRAAQDGNPVAANRLARLYAAGRGLPKDPLLAARWHLLARAKGIADPWLDGVLASLSPADKAKVEADLRKILAE